MRLRRHRLVALLATLLLALAAAPACTSFSAQSRPNIIFVLTDDLTWNLVQYMPHVRQMQRDGATFDKFVVTDSLCCPSRATIFTGKYPHNTHVFSNWGKEGGFNTFHKRGEERDTFGVALHDGGYRTGLTGKFMNGYFPDHPFGGVGPYVPPGWDQWAVAGDGYPEFDYILNENGRIGYYGSTPHDYLVDVQSRLAQKFVGSASRDGKPFMLEVATFAPHRPATAAPRYREKFRDLPQPHGPSYNREAGNPLPWQVQPPLSPREDAFMQKLYQKRARSVQAVDDLVAGLQQQLRETGADRNTYLIFSSDNGYHLGEHRLRAGKETAYDSDIRVPLIVTGPGVPAGLRVPELTQTADLYPTFLDLTGTHDPGYADGRSLVPLMHGQQVRGWRQAALVEHRQPEPGIFAFDPDAQPPRSGDPPSYEAIRLANETYVEYVDGTAEYYDLRKDPYELTNTVADLSPERRQALHDTLRALAKCRGLASCIAAGRIHQ